MAEGVDGPQAARQTAPMFPARARPDPLPPAAGADALALAGLADPAGAAALRALPGPPAGAVELAAMLHRLNDWVPQVRAAAEVLLALWLRIQRFARCSEAGHTAPAVADAAARDRAARQRMLPASALPDLAQLDPARARAQAERLAAACNAAVRIRARWWLERACG
jgi:hypothetical protein